MGIKNSVPSWEGTFYKILPESLKKDDFQYKMGLNYYGEIDMNSNEQKGIVFSRYEELFLDICSGTKIATFELLPDSIYTGRSPGSPHVTDKIFINKIEDIPDKVYEESLEAIPSNIKCVPEKRRTLNMYKSMVKRDLNAVKYIPVKYHDELLSSGVFKNKFE